MSELPQSQRELAEIKRRIEVELRTQNELENIAREVGAVKDTVTRTEAKVDEIDRRPPQVEQWAEKVAAVKANTSRIQDLEPRVEGHDRALRWVQGVLGAVLVGILIRWGWVLLQNGVG